MSKSDEPDEISCYFRGGRMVKEHRFEATRFIRVLWKCTKCDSRYHKMYEDDDGVDDRKERRKRWH